MTDEPKKPSDYEPLPDSRPSLAYALLAVFVSAAGVVVFLSLVVQPLLEWWYGD